MKNVKNRKELLRYYMSLPYSIRVVPEEAGGYFGELEELTGCITQGDTIEELMRNIEEAKEGWLTVAIEKGIEIPLPEIMKEYSGKLLLRIPKSLHKRLAGLAKRERVSLNQMIVSLLSERITTREIRDEIQRIPWKMGKIAMEYLIEVERPRRFYIPKIRETPEMYQHEVA